MLFFILLLPLVAAVPVKPSAKTYILEIEDDTLKNVQFVGDAQPEIQLDLSGLHLKALDKNSLDNLVDVQSLNLANNSLKSLPDFVFSNLTKLEYLSLAENKISDLKYMFVGLENLRVLNISQNPVVHLRRGHLFGLTKAARILTDGNVFWSISTGAFTNAFLKEEDDLGKQEAVDNKEQLLESKAEKDSAVDSMQRDTEAALELQETATTKVLKKDQKLMVCITENIVVSLGTLEKEQSLPEGCTKLSVDEKEKKVTLRGLGIKGFQEGWYQLQALPIASLDLTNNEITEITKETLNDLPADLVYVNLSENRIRRIWSQVIENLYLKMLNLKDNGIEAIEQDALSKTQLTGLFLTGNQLDDLTFVSSLPPTITEFVLTNNQISSIPNEAFSNMSRLVYLNMGNNQISRLQNNAFKGLDSLQVLILTRNSLSEIELEAFNDLKQLTTLYLYRNSLSELSKGTFSGLESLKDLNLAWNKFTKLTQDTFADLPKILDFLHLDFNEITSLPAGSFAEVPRFTLSLNGNNISRIEQGAFNLPSLQDLHLNNNDLETIDGDSYEGLPHLKHLWLSENKISEIRKGACRNMGSLNILDISKNPFQQLENGALYGLSAARGNFLYIYNNHLKEIEGGVFDDV